MSKLETVRGLADSRPVPPVVASMTELQSSMDEMKRDLEKLPQAISNEAARALMPFQELQNVSKIADQLLTQFNEIERVQRAALDEMSERLAKDAAEKIGQKVEALSSVVDGLNKNLTNLNNNVKVTYEAAKAAQQMKESQENSALRFERRTEELIRGWRVVAPTWWKLTLWLMVAGMAGSFLAGIGQAAFEHLAPPSDVQQQALEYRLMMGNATPQEKKAIDQIIERTPQ